MSPIASNNRLTTYSDSDAAFVSCTALSIHQTTLNIEEMAGINGLCHYEQEEEDSTIPTPPSQATIMYYVWRAKRRIETPIVYSSYSLW